MADTMLELRDLRTWFGSRERPVRAVDGVSFRVPRGSIMALVGESGCGKSVTALSIGRLLAQPPVSFMGGRILYDGVDLLTLSERRLRRLRGREIAYVFQDPVSALNPVLRIGPQLMEAVGLHRAAVDPAAEALRLLSIVGLPEPGRRLRAYPHQLSGGMQQRVMIAMALASSPRLLIADEPTTALDVTIQAQILELLTSLRRRHGMSILLITHNFGLVAETADFVNVMYAGRIVEGGRVEDVLARPAHPYTRGLLDAVPTLSARGDEALPAVGPARRPVAQRVLGLFARAPKRAARDAGTAGGAAAARLTGIPGTVPHPARLPGGCLFHPRCSRCRDDCRMREPAVAPVGGGDWPQGAASEDRDAAPDPARHVVRCWYPLEARA